MTLADRRRVTRFEFVEDQWGSLQTLEPLGLRNLGPDGLLIESVTPLSVGSIHTIRLMHKASAAQCQVSVRHLTPGSATGTGQPYLVGLQFVNLDDQATALVQQVLSEPAGQEDPVVLNEA